MLGAKKWHYEKTSQPCREYRDKLKHRSFFPESRHSAGACDGFLEGLVSVSRALTQPPDDRPGIEPRGGHYITADSPTQHHSKCIRVGRSGMSVSEINTSKEKKKKEEIKPSESGHRLSHVRAGSKASDRCTGHYKVERNSPKQTLDARINSQRGNRDNKHCMDIWDCFSSEVQ